METLRSAISTASDKKVLPFLVGPESRLDFADAACHLVTPQVSDIHMMIRPCSSKSRRWPHRASPVHVQVRNVWQQSHISYIEQLPTTHAQVSSPQFASPLQLVRDVSGAPCLAHIDNTLSSRSCLTPCQTLKYLSTLCSALSREHDKRHNRGLTLAVTDRCSCSRGSL